MSAARWDTAEYIWSVAKKRVGTRVDHFQCCCPAHDDKSPSLSVHLDADRGLLLLHCHAGCTPEEVTAAFGLEMADLSPAKQLPAKLNGNAKHLPVKSAAKGAIDVYGPVVSMSIDPEAMQPIEWLWEGMIPDKAITIIYGEPGAGKTTVALSIAASMTRGKMPDGLACTPSSVLVWCGEDDTQRVVIPRLVAAGAVSDLTHVVKGRMVTRADGTVEVAPFNPVMDMAALHELRREKAAKLVILDNVVDLIEGDSNNNENVRKALAPLNAACQDESFAVIAISHTRKAKDGINAIDRMIGSRAFGAIARMCLYAIADPGEGEEPAENCYQLLRAKSSLGIAGGGYSYETQGAIVRNSKAEMPASIVRWGTYQPGAVDIIIRGIERKQERENAPADGSKLDIAIRIVRENLREGGKSRKDLENIAKGAGISNSTLYRAIASEQKNNGLENYMRVKGVPGYYYPISQGVPG
jgi:putative DNA primase/helicase